jgi:hypothetical protein
MSVKSDLIRPLTVKIITTSKGSVYTMFPNGQSIRFKKSCNEVCALQDLIVFVDLDFAATQIVLHAIHDRPRLRKVYITDLEGNVIDHTKDIVGNKCYLVVINSKSNEVLNSFKASTVPVLAWKVYDQRRYVENNNNYREQHIGHAVVKITET